MNGEISKGFSNSTALRLARGLFPFNGSGEFRVSRGERRFFVLERRNFSAEECFLVAERSERSGLSAHVLFKGFENRIVGDVVRQGNTPRREPADQQLF